MQDNEITDYVEELVVYVSKKHLITLHMLYILGVIVLVVYEESSLTAIQTCALAIILVIIIDVAWTVYKVDVREGYLHLFFIG